MYIGTEFDVNPLDVLLRAFAPNTTIKIGYHKRRDYETHRTQHLFDYDVNGIVSRRHWAYYDEQHIETPFHYFADVALADLVRKGQKTKPRESEDVCLILECNDVTMQGWEKVGV